VITFVLVMVGIVLPVVVLVASIISARAGVADRNAAQRQLRAAYRAAGVTPPSGL
jgi:hypothetical protein